MEDNFDYEGLKVKVNNFLWETLPDDVTIGTAEVIACGIVGIIVDKLTELKS